MGTRILHWLIVVAMPVALGFGVITLVINPAYPRYEYAKANFPADPYGFTQQQRLELALVSVAYLESWDSAESTIHMLEAQTIPGSDLPLFNAREISHMLDVKIVTDAIRWIMLGAMGLIALCLILLLRDPASRPQAYAAIWRGGLATVLILLVIAGFIILGWSIFFVQFHELLFPAGTWTFNLSDGLIRLYPEKFFFDVGVIMSVGSLLAGVVTAALGYVLRRTAPGVPG